MRKLIVVFFVSLAAFNALAECGINAPACPLGGSSKPVCISGKWQCM